VSVPIINASLILRAMKVKSSFNNTFLINARRKNPIGIDCDSTKQHSTESFISNHGNFFFSRRSIRRGAHFTHHPID